MMGLVAWALIRPPARAARIRSRVTTPPNLPPSSTTATDVSDVMMISIAARRVLVAATWAAGTVRGRSASGRPSVEGLPGDPAEEDAVGGEAEPVAAVGGHGRPGVVGGGGGHVDHRSPGERRIVEGQVGDGGQGEAADAAVAADEAFDELVGRGPQEVVGRGVLLEDAAHVEQGDAVGQLDGLVEVVGDEDDRLVDPGLEPEQLVLQAAPDDGVDRPEGLVHEEDGRVGGQGPGHAHPLLLAAGELVRVAVEHGRLEAHQVGQLPDPGRDAVLVPPEGAGDGADVAGHGVVGEEAHLLDHVADAPAQLGHGRLG